MKLSSQYSCNREQFANEERMALLKVLEESETIHGWAISLSQ